MSATVAATQHSAAGGHQSGLQTEFEFVLPRGYVDSNGTVHRAGTMRIARARDEIYPQSDPKVRENPSYLTVILLTRTITELGTLPEVDTSLPSGAMYAFFRLPEAENSLAFCKNLVKSAGLGLAPGIAFGPEGEGFVRWCFAASEERLEKGFERLQMALRRR